MFDKKDEPVAQFVDRFIVRMMVCVSLMAVSYSCAAGLHFVADTIQGYLDTARTATGLLAAALILPLFIKLFWLRKKYPAAFSCEMGFMENIMARAGEKAFALTFVFLVLVEPIALNMLHDLPPAFFLQTAITFSLAVFAISFHIYNRAADMEDDAFEGEDV